MVDIQPAAAEIRRGKKEEDRRKKPQGKNIRPSLLHRADITTKPVFILVILTLGRFLKTGGVAVGGVRGEASRIPASSD